MKEQAQTEFKKGSYSEAIALYKQAQELLEISQDDFDDYLKKELAQLEATIFSNLAFCHSKDSNDNAVVTNCAKVIERALFISDVNLVIKAYLRRGLTLERLEKYREAVNDLTRVREM